MDIQQQAFIKNVKRICIENYNLCNRKCRYCPMSLGIRTSKPIQLSEDLYISFLSGLSNVNYCGSFALGRYHEPLMFPDITLRRIALACQMIPASTFFLNTNGDFLNMDILHALYEAGLNEIKIMRYLDNADDFSDYLAYSQCMDLVEKLGLTINHINIAENDITYFDVETSFALKMSIRCENYKNGRGCNRGGLINELDTPRKQPCFSPIHEINIDYNGCVLPCCNMISDSDEHKKYIVGNIASDNIFNIYYNAYNSKFTNDVKSGNVIEYLTCRNCNYVFGRG